MKDLTGFWEQRARDALVGRKIVDVQYMTKENAKEHGWFARPLFLKLDDGSVVFPQSDDEGNDGGALGHGLPPWGRRRRRTVFPVLR